MNKYFNLSRDQTRDVNYVISEIISMQKEMFPDQTTVLTEGFLSDMKGLFAKSSETTEAEILNYHSYEHTLQATLCFVRLVYNRHFLNIEPILSPEKFLIGLAAIVMHDVGYLKNSSEIQQIKSQTGLMVAQENSNYGRVYLEGKNWQPVDILSVEMLISCTGPHAIIPKMSFLDEMDEHMAYCLETADYLGQMSDLRYIDKLYRLYDEFNENANFRDIPNDRRQYKSGYDLIRKTPGFWIYVLNEKLTKDCKSVYKYLNYPYPEGANPYIERIESNISKIKTIVSENITFSSHSS